MRPVVWRAMVNAPAFDLPSGASVEITDASPDQAEAILSALEGKGFKAQYVDRPSGMANIVVVTEGLSGRTESSRHWDTLVAARQARRPGGVILLLQSSGIPSGLDGLSRTLRKEWDECPCYAWTLDGVASADIGNSVSQTLIDGVGDAWIDQSGHRKVPVTGASLRPATLGPRNENAVWLVTGGARGVTSACAIEIAAAAGGTILLAGRSQETPWPHDLKQTGDIKTLRGLLASRHVAAGKRVSPAEIDREARSLLAGAEIRATVAAIEATGATAVYAPLDIADPASVSGTLASLQARYGQVTGLVHGAGVLADRLAADKTEAELRRVFAPKVDGLANILNALDLASLTHVGLFSSAAAFYGNRGQSDYAMANAFLASFARNLHSKLDAQIKAFHWGPWAGGMVDAALASHFEDQGIALIPVQEGARIFARELLGGSREHVELVVGEAWSEA